MGTIYGCQDANQEECYKYTDWEKWKSGTCVWLEGFGFYCDVGDDDESVTVTTEEMMAMEVAAMMIATTIVIR